MLTNNRESEIQHRPETLTMPTLDTDPWLAVTAECPLRLCRACHRDGRCFHVTLPQRPGKVLCFREDSELPPEWAATEAQERANQETLL